MERPDFLDRGEAARLIPVVADNSREARAASVLMATFMAVPAYAREVFSTISQRVGKRSDLQCFSEIRFKNSEGINLRPDGLIILDGGRGRSWRCLVEAKIGGSELESTQVESYLTLAKQNDIDAVVTISNQFAALPTHTPVKISRSFTRGVDLYHWSWAYLRTTAQLLMNDDASSMTDDQKYIVSEFHRYLNHDSTGANRFDRMNSEWKEIVGMVISNATLSKNSSIVENTVAAWHQEARDLCLLMSEQVHRSVALKLSRAHSNDPQERLRDDSEHLASRSELTCTLEIPDAAGPLIVSANLKTRSICVSMSLAAPRDRQRASSRINWVLRQLAKAEADDIYIKCNWPGRATSTQRRLAEVRQNADCLISDNGSMLPHSFDVMLVRDIAGKFSGTRTFIEQLEEAVPDFYTSIGQYLRAYVPPPPQIKNLEGQERSDAGENGDLAGGAEERPIDVVGDQPKESVIASELPIGDGQVGKEGDSGTDIQIAKT